MNFNSRFNPHTSKPNSEQQHFGNIFKQKIDFKSIDINESQNISS